MTKLKWRRLAAARFHLFDSFYIQFWTLPNSWGANCFLRLSWKYWIPFSVCKTCFKSQSLHKVQSPLEWPQWIPGPSGKSFQKWTESEAELTELMIRTYLGHLHLCKSWTFAQELLDRTNYIEMSCSFSLKKSVPTKPIRIKMSGNP